MGLTIKNKKEEYRKIYNDIRVTIGLYLISLRQK